jgi:hypothetical protein
MGEPDPPRDSWENQQKAPTPLGAGAFLAELMWRIYSDLAHLPSDNTGKASVEHPTR